VGIKNWSTTISAEKTAGEVMGILGRKGASRISMTYDEVGTLSGMSFVLRTEYGPQGFALPVRVSGMLTAMERDRTVPASKCTPEQASRVAWRTAKEWLTVQIALIEAGLASLDEVMLPYALADNGQTMYQVMRESKMRALEKGQA
jgi:hypothetical protein